MVMNNSRSIVTGIDPFNRIPDYRFSQKSFRIPQTDALIHRIFHTAALHMDVLSDLQKDDRHPCILADRDHIIRRNFEIFRKLIQDLLP